MPHCHTHRALLSPFFRSLAVVVVSHQLTMAVAHYDKIGKVFYRLTIRAGGEGDIGETGKFSEDQILTSIYIMYKHVQCSSYS